MGNDLEKQRDELLQKMELRHCKCGCGRSFKTLPASRQKFFSNDECPVLNKKKLARIQYGKGARYE